MSVLKAKTNSKRKTRQGVSTLIANINARADWHVYCNLKRRELR